MHQQPPKMPGNEQKGPLATASDGIHWDVQNQVFQVKFPQAMGGGMEVWETKKTVFENGMGKFGSSRPGDPKSKPAATLTYDMLWVVDMPDGSKQLCVFTAARTGATPTQNFISTVKAKGVDKFYQRYQIVSRQSLDDVKVATLGFAAAGFERPAVQHVLQQIAEALRKHPIAEYLGGETNVGSEVV